MRMGVGACQPDDLPPARAAVPLRQARTGAVEQGRKRLGWSEQLPNDRPSEGAA